MLIEQDDFTQKHLTQLKASVRNHQTLHSYISIFLFVLPNSLNQQIIKNNSFHGFPVMLYFSYKQIFYLKISMKKGENKVFQSLPISQPTSQAFLTNLQSSQFKYFKIKETSMYPHNLMVYIVANIEQVVKVKGSGCLIGNGCVLTAAHNVQPIQAQIQAIDDNKGKIQDKTIIYQGLKEQCICQYKVKEYYIGENFPKQQRNDYAILKVIPKIQAKKPVQKYMPIVFLPQQIIKDLQVQLCGFPIDQKKPQDEDINKSYQMQYLQGVLQKITEVSPSKIKYQNPTTQGFSGAPLIAFYKEEYVIIGIHKGGNAVQNVGVSAGHMLQKLNQLGYTLKNGPFVYTQNTFQIREQLKQLNQSTILMQIDQNIKDQDILVYTAFDLSRMIRITLSGNQIGSFGLKHLLKRKFQYLKSLYLHQNQIKELPKDKKSWENVKNLQFLGLSLNSLKTLPQEMSELTKLKKLWVSFNQFKTIPKAIGLICLKNLNENLKIYIYENLINLKEQSKLINELSQKASIFWQKQDIDVEG